MDNKEQSYYLSWLIVPLRYGNEKEYSPPDTGGIENLL